MAPCRSRNDRHWIDFAAGVGAVASVIGAFIWIGGGITGRELVEIAGKSAVAAFLLGVAFSGVLAVTARGRPFNKLSLRLVGALGAGAGVLYFVFLALNGGRNWSPSDAIANLVLLPLMGAASAAATLLIARRASSSLGSGRELPNLTAGDEEIVQAGRRAEAEARRR